MDWLYAFVGGDTAPGLVAFALGLLVALDGCTLATAITAMGYIAHGEYSRRVVLQRGLLYALGRTVSYFLLAELIVPLLRGLGAVDALHGVLELYGGLVFGPALISIGVLMLSGWALRWPTQRITRWGRGLMLRRFWGPLLLGMFFALAICPSIGVLYFGMLVPMVAASGWGYVLLLIFSLTTALPVVVLAWLLAYSLDRVGGFYHRVRRVHQWLNIGVACLFVVAGLQQLWEGLAH